MARNRKRAKERRSRRPPGSSLDRPGVATARAQLEDSTPSPIEHAAPDVELADAQLALGRPDLAEEPEAEDEPDLDFESPADGDGADSLAAADLDSDAPSLAGHGSPPGGGELTTPGGRAPEPHSRSGNRLINFLQGSWRELQRVQWPDRRQVVQATGVVIGFVIVAGVFLGVADDIAGKIVTFILK